MYTWSLSTRVVYVHVLVYCTHTYCQNKSLYHNLHTAPSNICHPDAGVALSIVMRSDHTFHKPQWSVIVTIADVDILPK